MPRQKDDNLAKKPDAAGRKVYAGGNPAFDERRAPKEKPPISKRVYAGGNPTFDERDAPVKPRQDEDK